MDCVCTVNVRAEVISRRRKVSFSSFEADLRSAPQDEVPYSSKQKKVLILRSAKRVSKDGGIGNYP